MISFKSSRFEHIYYWEGVLVILKTVESGIHVCVRASREALLLSLSTTLYPLLSASKTCPDMTEKRVNFGVKIETYQQTKQVHVLKAAYSVTTNIFRKTNIFFLNHL